MEKVPVKIKKLPNFPSNFELPNYATEKASGFDLQSVIAVELPPRATMVIPTGLAVALPDGYELQIRPRSGNSLKTALRISNSPGTIDGDYRGEVGVIVSNYSIEKHLSIDVGQKVAQGVIAPVVQASFEEVEKLDDTIRGSSGFGSTGA